MLVGRLGLGRRWLLDMDPLGLGLGLLMKALLQSVRRGSYARCFGYENYASGVLSGSPEVNLCPIHSEELRLF
jgi:hypothetical protein